jgi:hypothetical protein
MAHFAAAVAAHTGTADVASAVSAMSELRIVAAMSVSAAKQRWVSV